jgi:hypothetical protein
MNALDRALGRRSRFVDVDSQVNLQYWSRELGCSEWGLLDAVAFVGPDVEDLREHLRRQLCLRQDGV